MKYWKDLWILWRHSKEVPAETNLIHADIGCGDFLKAKAAHKKRRSTDVNDWVAGWQSGRKRKDYEYEAAIAHFREVVPEFQRKNMIT